MCVCVCVCIVKIQGVLNRPFSNMLSSDGAKGSRDGLGMSLMGELNNTCILGALVCIESMFVYVNTFILVHVA